MKPKSLNSSLPPFDAAFASLNKPKIAAKLENIASKITTRMTTALSSWRAARVRILSEWQSVMRRKDIIR